MWRLFVSSPHINFTAKLCTNFAVKNNFFFYQYLTYFSDFSSTPPPRSSILRMESKILRGFGVDVVGSSTGHLQLQSTCHYTYKTYGTCTGGGGGLGRDGNNLQPLSFSRGAQTERINYFLE